MLNLIMLPSSRELQWPLRRSTRPFTDHGPGRQDHSHAGHFAALALSRSQARVARHFFIAARRQPVRPAGRSLRCSARWTLGHGSPTPARIYGHPEVAARLGDTSGFEAVTGGHDVDGTARLHLPGPPRSEQPIEIPARRALAFGDAAVETGGGELRLWDDPVHSERRRRWWHERYLRRDPGQRPKR